MTHLFYLYFGNFSYFNGPFDDLNDSRFVFVSKKGNRVKQMSNTPLTDNEFAYYITLFCFTALIFLTRALNISGIHNSEILLPFFSWSRFS